MTPYELERANIQALGYDPDTSAALNRMQRAAGLPVLTSVILSNVDRWGTQGFRDQLRALSAQGKAQRHDGDD